jgi:hypothetical protein
MKHNEDIRQELHTTSLFSMTKKSGKLVWTSQKNKKGAEPKMCTELQTSWGEKLRMPTNDMEPRVLLGAGTGQNPKHDDDDKLWVLNWFWNIINTGTVTAVAWMSRQHHEPHSKKTA